MSDLIRREDVDKAIRSICDLCGEDKKYNGVMCGACNLDSFIREYDDLPSAEPERKKGKWSNYKDEHSCSVCQSVVISDCWNDEIRYDYCPYCGSDMRGGNDDTNS